MSKSSEINWKDKYEAMKSSYSKLDRLRHSSVSEDIKDLKQKIKEHEEIHIISITELQNQNQQMQEAIDRSRETKKKIAEKENKVDKLKKELGQLDPVLKQAFEVKKLHVRDARRNYYQFEYDNKFVFELLTARDKDDYEYRLISQCESLPDLFKDPFKFHKNKIQQFFQQFNTL